MDPNHDIGRPKCTDFAVESMAAARPNAGARRSDIQRISQVVNRGSLRPAGPVCLPSGGAHVSSQSGGVLAKARWCHCCTTSNLKPDWAIRFRKGGMHHRPRSPLRSPAAGGMQRGGGEGMRSSLVCALRRSGCGRGASARLRRPTVWPRLAAHMSAFPHGSACVKSPCGPCCLHQRSSMEVGRRAGCDLAEL